eukprot:14092919-Alexandrium_andersonii.AAC.1
MKATGTPAMTPAATMAKPSLLEALVRGPPRLSSGQRGPARAASAKRTCGGAECARAGGPAAR